jgi:hypothetical protein
LEIQILLRQVFTKKHAKAIEGYGVKLFSFYNKKKYKKIDFIIKCSVKEYSKFNGNDLISRHCSNKGYSSNYNTPPI